MTSGYVPLGVTTLPFKVEVTQFMVIVGLESTDPLMRWDGIVQPLGFCDTIEEANTLVSRFAQFKPTIHVITREVDV